MLVLNKRLVESKMYFPFSKNDDRIVVKLSMMVDMLSFTLLLVLVKYYKQTIGKIEKTIFRFFAYIISTRSSDSPVEL